MGGEERREKEKVKGRKEEKIGEEQERIKGEYEKREREVGTGLVEGKNEITTSASTEISSVP